MATKKKTQQKNYNFYALFNGRTAGGNTLLEAYKKLRAAYSYNKPEATQVQFYKNRVKVSVKLEIKARG